MGSNLGPRQEHLKAAVHALADEASVSVEAVSPLYETASVGGPPDAPAYLNGCIAGRSTLDPEQLLERLLAIEVSRQRHRTGRNHPRTLDLDLLLCGDLLRSQPGLVLPHPRLTLRAFVLVPAAEIAGEAIHPVTGLSLRRHRDLLGDLSSLEPATLSDWPPAL